MVLLWRDDAGDAGPSPFIFNGASDSDVTKFLFVYENVVMRGKSEEDKAGSILCHLEGAAFDFYYETYSRDGGLSEAAGDWKEVKKALADRFVVTARPEEEIQKAIACRLEVDALLPSLEQMEKLYEKAGFNEEAKYGLLRNAVMGHLEVAQFAILRSPTTYDELKKTVKDFAVGRDAFRAARASSSVNDQTPKKVLQRPDAGPKQEKLESKVDELATQLAELSLMMKKKQQTPAESGPTWTCSFCKEPGHSASRCRSNPHRDTRCPNCGKIGHSGETCWSRAEPKKGSQSAGAGGKPNADDHDGSKQVTFVTESTAGEVVAATKRSAEGEALPKQMRTGEEIAVPRLLNPAPVAPTGIPVQPQEPMIRRPGRKKKRNIAKKASLEEHVRKYNVVSELANAPSGLTFGQLVRGDAESARKEINRLLTKKVRRGRGFAGHAETRPRRLRLVTVQVYGSDAQALLDSGAVPNIVSPQLVKRLSLTPEATTKHITVANGKNASCIGALHQIPVSFGGLVSKMDFLVVSGAPYDVIIGLPSLEELQTCMDLGQQHVEVTVDDQKARLGLEMDDGRKLVDSSTESEDFTSDSDAIPEDSTEEDEFVLALHEQAPFEPDLALEGDGSNEEDPYVGVPELVELDEEEPESDSEDEEEDDAEEEQDSLLRSKLCHIMKEEADRIVESIKARGIAAWSLDDLRPSDVPVSHSFELVDPTPISHSARRLPPPKHNEVVREELEKMEKAGIITPSVSAWSFPVVIATKKDGKPRFCVDYRLLNKVMKADKWPLPKMEEIFDDLEGNKVFTTLDLFSGYWQVRMAAHCKEKTTFVCRYGTFQFEVMPFGLMNAPSTFQRMMDGIFRGLPFLRVYLDDVVVFSNSLSSHADHLLQVFGLIADNGLKLKIAKCAFAQSQTRLLGHVISGAGIKVDPEKITIILNTPELRNVTELRSFLGLAGYYRRFIPKFAEVSASLHAATSSKLKFQFSDEMREAFVELKEKLTSPPLLALPDFDEPFVVETGASSIAVGAVLPQKKEDGKIHPIQYASRTMTSTEKNYSACEREALAVIFALKKFRVYLLSTQKFTLITDHQALQYAFKKKYIHGRLARWLDFLAEYEFEIRYRAGGKNGAADFLSRLREGEPNTSEPDDGDLICNAHDADRKQLEDLEPHLRDTYLYLEGEEMEDQDADQRRRVRKNAKRFLSWNGNLFRRTKGGIRFIPPRSARVQILRMLHDNIGHWDVTTTKQFVLDRYWWPAVYRDIYDYVRGCQGCQKASSIPRYTHTAIIPLSSLFETFSIDFAGPLPKTKNGKQYILIAVEHLTGWPLAWATETATAAEVVKFVKEEIIHSFGPPRTIVSDNATCFSAATLKNFIRNHDISWKPVLAYAPMSNGKAERMVGTLKRAIRKTLLGNGAPGAEWEQELNQVLYGYRRRRMADGYSPFELMYGVGPRSQPGPELDPIPKGGVHARELELLAALAYRATRVARQKKKEERLPKAASSRRFNVGDQVLVERGAALGALQKWPLGISKFYGPCRVVKARHPRYTLISPGARYSRRDIHAGRLIPFIQKPAHLQ